MAKTRGLSLGNPIKTAKLRWAGKGGGALRAVVATNADRFGPDLGGGVAVIRAASAVSRRAVAADLTPRGIKTRRGRDWQVSNVKRLLIRSGGGIPCNGCGLLALSMGAAGN